MHRCLLLLFLLCFFQPVFSQQEKQYAFTHYSTANGLVSNTVYSIVQDKQGYIWMATIDGLQRFDGKRFITFRHSSTNPHSIPADFVPQLNIDKDGNLWLYTGNKIGFFDPHTFLFTAVPVEDEDPSNPYNITFYGNAYNGYMILHAADVGFFLYDPLLKKFKRTISFKTPENKRLYGIANINETEFWISIDGGIIVYNVKTGNLNYRGHNPDKNIYINAVKSDTAGAGFFARVNDTLWYNSWPLVAWAPFIHKLSLKTGEKETYSINREFNFGYTEIGGHLFQQNGRKWFYGRSYIVEYTGNKKTPFRLIQNAYTGDQSITFDRVFKMIEDRQHNIWIATDNGAYVFNPDMQVFDIHKVQRTTDAQPHEAPVSEAVELKNGNILISTWGNGLFCYDNNFNPIPMLPGLQELTRDYMMWCLHEHSKTGLIWMGFQGGSLGIYDAAKKRLELLHEKAFAGSTIRKVTEDKFGNLWFGLQSGSVVKWNIDTANGDFRKGYEVIERRKGYYVQKMYTGKDGAVWVGYINGGLDKYDAATNKLLFHYSKNNLNNEGLWSNNVNDLYAYNDSLLLIADDALDILNLNTNKITHISTETGLPSNTVVSIEADDKGILWLGMANQLCRFNLSRKIFSTFDRKDGITYDLFVADGDYKLKDGRLVYLTDKNFVVFNPLSVASEKLPDKVMITNFKAGNQFLSIDSLNSLPAVTLPYNNTSFSIEFSAMNFTPQNKLNYYYMLEDIDKAYHPASSLNEAVYSYLPAGNYTFKVKAENTEGKETAVTELHIRVVPPFWLRWWFFGLIILLVFAVFYWIDKERIKKIQALHKVRTQIARNLHNDVNTTLNHISLLSEMARIKADKDLDMSKDFIEQINTKSRSMIDGMNDMMWTLNPQNDSMDKTILRMKEYAEALQNTYPVQIQMEVDETVRLLKTDMKLRHEIFLIFKTTLRCIAETGSTVPTLINIDYHNRKILLKIYNGATSFENTNAEQAIQQIHERAGVLNAELDIQTDKGISLILLAPVHQQ